MGYYTDYWLTVDNVPGRTADMDAIDKVICERFSDVFENFALGDYQGAEKWYDHDADMLELSMQFPDALFYLEGKGDTWDDMWGHYYLNGWMQTGGIEIVTHPFDPAKLEAAAGAAPESPFVSQKEISNEQFDAILLS